MRELSIRTIRRDRWTPDEVIFQIGQEGVQPLRKLLLREHSAHEVGLSEGWRQEILTTWLKPQRPRLIAPIKVMHPRNEELLEVRILNLTRPI